MPDTNPLQRETERQNRLYQDAIARKKQQARPEHVRVEPNFTGPPAGARPANRFALPPENRPLINTDSAGTDTPHQMSPAAPEAPSERAAEPAAQAWDAKLCRLPEIRSALIALDTQTDAAAWSKPFSLVRADMEPWLSFYSGYKQSRLFTENSSHPAGAAVPSVDFAVRALLDLKQVDIKAILEPPVQINGQVEYAALEEELRVCRNEAGARSLIQSANDLHEAQLRNAIDRGREMGASLYDALMGEGHGNLIKAWESVHRRRPTVEELHRMLTTGRTTSAPPKRTGAQGAPENYAENLIEAAAKPASVVPAVQKPLASLAATAVPAAPEKVVADTAAAQENVGWVKKKLAALSPRRRILVPVFFAAAGCTVLVALGLAGII